MRQFRPFLFAAAAAAALAGATGCAPTRDVRGHVFAPDSLDRLQPGLDSRASVAAALGTPSAVGTFDPNRWYYISRTTETTAFLDPDVLDQQVLVLAFNDAGVLTDVHRFGLADAYRITLVDRITPTHGRELGIVEQLVGNIGRFNPE